MQNAVLHKHKHTHTHTMPNSNKMADKVTRGRRRGRGRVASGNKNTKYAGKGSKRKTQNRRTKNCILIMCNWHSSM